VLHVHHHSQQVLTQAGKQGVLLLMCPGCAGGASVCCVCASLAGFVLVCAGVWVCHCSDTQPRWHVLSQELFVSILEALVSTGRESLARLNMVACCITAGVVIP
jgi:hypothetical protein